MSLLFPNLVELKVTYTSQAANPQWKSYWCLRRRK